VRQSIPFPSGRPLAQDGRGEVGALTFKQLVLHYDFGR
jgi:hypothetical protein